MCRFITRHAHAVPATQVLAHVATRLRDMHQAQLVHRDVKPPNIMLLPRENRWTVIDFGTVARVGAEVPLACTVKYSPPEVVLALDARVGSVVADPAIDAWALGVVAFELLTGRSTFDILADGKAAVRSFAARCPARLGHDQPLYGAAGRDATLCQSTS